MFLRSSCNASRIASPVATISLMRSVAWAAFTGSNVFGIWAKRVLSSFSVNGFGSSRLLSSFDTGSNCFQRGSYTTEQYPLIRSKFCAAARCAEDAERNVLLGFFCRVVVNSTSHDACGPIAWRNLSFTFLRHLAISRCGLPYSSRNPSSLQKLLLGQNRWARIHWPEASDLNCCGSPVAGNQQDQAPAPRSARMRGENARPLKIRL